MIEFVIRWFLRRHSVYIGRDGYIHVRNDAAGSSIIVGDVHQDLLPSRRPSYRN